MAEVRAVFTLTDRMSNRLQKIERTALAAEKALGVLDRKIDRINRKINVLHLALAGLTARSINIRADMDIKPIMAKAAIVRGIKSDLGRTIRSSGGIGASSFSGSGAAASFIRQSANGLPMTSGGAVQGNRGLGLALSGLAGMGGTGGRPSRVSSIFDPFITPIRSVGTLGSFDDQLFGDSANSDSGNGGGATGRRRINFRNFNARELLRSKELNKRQEAANKRLNKILAGGRGGYFRGASLGVVLAGSGLLSAATGLAGGLGAGALGVVLAGALAAGGLAGTLAAGAIPLATGTKKNYDALQTARENLANAKTAEEYAAASAELAKAQASITPVQQQLITDTQRLKGVYKGLFDPIQQNIANIYSKFTSAAQVTQGTIAPAIQRFGGLGESLAGSARSFIGDPREQALIKRFMEGLVPLSGLATKSLGKLAFTMERLVIAVTPLATWMFKGINEQLDGILNRTKDGDLTGWTKSFDQFRPVLSALASLMGDLGDSLARMFVDVIPFTVTFIEQVRTRLLPALEEIIRVGAEIAGPEVLDAIGQLLIAIADSAEPLARILAVLANVLEGVLFLFNQFDRLTGGWGGAGLIILFGSALVIFKIVRAYAALRDVLVGTKVAAWGMKIMGKGMFGPLIAGAKLARDAIVKLLAKMGLLKVATSTVAGGAATGGGATVLAGGGGKGGKGGKGRFAKILAGAGMVGSRLLGPLGAGLIGSDVATMAFPEIAGGGSAWTKPHPIQDYFNPTKWDDIVGGGGRKPLRNQPGLAQAIGAKQSTSAVVNITGPININNGQDEQQFFEKLRRSVTTSRENMPQQGYEAGGIRIGGGG